MSNVNFSFLISLSYLIAGNSNSVAHLVENEMPTSSTHRPNSVDDELVSPSDDTFDHLSNFNHMSGSYSNLYREKFDDEPNEISIAQNVSTRNLAAQNSPTTNVPSEMVENVYCNIPSQYGGMSPSAMVQSSSPESSNPNLHLYSNVTLANEAQDAVAVASTPLSSDNQNRNGSNQTKIKSGPMATLTSSNSLLMSDDLDLDLDDPVMAVGTPVKRSTNSTNTDYTPTANSSRKPAISIELKQVAAVDTVPIKGDHRQQMNNPNGAIDATMNSSRLLLHDTMIDTALDLDSLDGTNLDNSQAFLVNRKPVA